MAETAVCAEAAQADFVHVLCARLGRAGRDECVGPPNGHNTYATHFAPPAGWLHRRAAVEPVGDWAATNRIPMGLDHDFMLRFLRAGKRGASAGG